MFKAKNLFQSAQNNAAYKIITQPEAFAFSKFNNVCTGQMLFQSFVAKYISIIFYQTKPCGSAFESISQQFEFISTDRDFVFNVPNNYFHKLLADLYNQNCVLKTFVCPTKSIDFWRYIYH